MKSLKSHVLMMGLLLTSAGLGCTDKKEGEVTAPSGGTSDSGGGDTSPLPQGDFRIIFVSTTEVYGTGSVSLSGGGISSMDAVCAQDAVTKRLGGTFKALVNDSANRQPLGSDWVLKAGKEYRREDMTTVIGTAVTTATDGVQIPIPFINSITATPKYPWTGFQGDWTPSTTNCSGWTVDVYDNTSASMGEYGKSSLADQELVDLGYTQYWIDAIFGVNDPATMRCDSLHPLYCVQVIQPPPSGPYKLVFVSTTTAKGNVGVAGFDSICAADAITKGLSGTYKALVASGANYSPMRRACQTADCTTGGATENVDWVLQPNMHYRREGGERHIGTTNANGVFDMPLVASFLDSGTYWTGINNTWTISAAGIGTGNCFDWTYDQADGDGMTGNGTSDGIASVSSSVMACSVARSVICVEQ